MEQILLTESYFGVAPEIGIRLHPSPPAPQQCSQVIWTVEGAIFIRMQTKRVSENLDGRIGFQKRIIEKPIILGETNKL